jgi:pilus assembly protein CpaB
MSTTPRKAPNGRRTLLFAVLFGLVAAGLAVYAVSLARPTEAAPIRMAAVVVPKQAIPARTTIRAEMVEVRQIPADSRHIDAMENVGDVLGKVSRQALVPGEQLLNARLINERTESGLAFVIPAGRRAVSIEVSETIGAGGLILPGDRVDVLGVCKARVEASAPTGGSSANGNTSSARSSGEVGKGVIVLQNIPVVAVAQHIEGDDNRSALDRANPSSRAGNAEQAKAKSATLAVTTAEAQRLVLYDEMCTLRLALRPESDNAVVEVRVEELTYDTIRP